VFALTTFSCRLTFAGHSGSNSKGFMSDSTVTAQAAGGTPKISKISEAVIRIAGNSVGRREAREVGARRRLGRGGARGGLSDGTDEARPPAVVGGGYHPARPEGQGLVDGGRRWRPAQGTAPRRWRQRPPRTGSRSQENQRNPS